MGESFLTPGAGVFADIAKLSIEPNGSLPDGAGASPNTNGDGKASPAPLNLNATVDPDANPACGGGPDSSSAATCKSQYAYINIINDLNCASIKIKKITIKSTTSVLPQRPNWYNGLRPASQGLVDDKAKLTLDDQKKGVSQDLDQSIAAPCTLHYYKGGSKKEFSSTVDVCSSTLGQREQYSICRGSLDIGDAMDDKAKDISDSLSSALNDQRDSDLKENQPKCKVTATVVNITVTP